MRGCSGLLGPGGDSGVGALGGRRRGRARRQRSRGPARSASGAPFRPPVARQTGAAPVCRGGPRIVLRSRQKVGSAAPGGSPRPGAPGTRTRPYRVSGGQSAAQNSGASLFDFPWSSVSLSPAKTFHTPQFITMNATRKIRQGILHPKITHHNRHYVEVNPKEENGRCSANIHRQPQ